MVGSLCACKRCSERGSAGFPELGKGVGGIKRVRSNVLRQGQQAFSIKGQMAHILGFTSHRVSVTVARLGLEIDHKLHIHRWVWLWTNKTLFTKTDCGPGLTVVYPFLSQKSVHMTMVAVSST